MRHHPGIVGWVRRFAAAAFLAILVGPGVAAAKETRVALVIGNGSYLNVSPLRNPPKDASGCCQRNLA